MAQAPYHAQFRHAVERLFAGWTGLNLAIEHGMGGPNARNIVVQMIDYVTEFCCVNKGLDIYEITNLLDELMDDEFETICEDNSTKELAQLLLRYINLCQSNMQEQMLAEVSQLPQCNTHMSKAQNLPTLPIQPNEVIHEDDGAEDDNDVDRDEPMEEEEADPGWTVVRTRRKN